MPVSGRPIPRGTVIVRDGLIEAAGENLAIPADCWIIEGDGLSVYPGLIDALSTLGLPEALQPPPPPTATTPARAPVPATPAATPAPVIRGPEDRPSTTSWVRAADAAVTTDRRVETMRSGGFTSAVSFPARGIVAGQGAVLNLGGERPSRMVVASPAGMYLTLSSGGFGGGFPGSLMGVIACIRQLYLDAAHYRMAKQAYAAKTSGARRPGYDRALEGVLETRRVLLPATHVFEMERMIRLAREIDADPVLYGAHEAFRNPGLLKQAGVPVLVSLKWPERARDANPEQRDSLRVLELRDRAASTPAALAKAGVPFAFYSDGTERPADLMRAVHRAILDGLSADDALKALTLAAAQIYGVGDRLGSIEPGKIANLLVTKGDLFADQTQVQFVLIDGVKYEPVPEAPPAGAGAGRGVTQ